jgi:hypothetical protein
MKKAGGDQPFSRDRTDIGLWPKPGAASANEGRRFLVADRKKERQNPDEETSSRAGGEYPPRNHLKG